MCQRLVIFSLASSSSYRHYASCKAGLSILVFVFTSVSFFVSFRLMTRIKQKGATEESEKEKSHPKFAI